MGMREYSYCAAILSLAMALDDKNFLGAELPASRNTKVTGIGKRLSVSGIYHPSAV